MTFKGKKHSLTTKLKIGNSVRQIDSDKIIKLHKNKLSDREIAKELNTTPSDIFYNRKRLNLSNLGHKKECQCGVCKAKIGENYNLGRIGEEHPLWKGEQIVYSRLHIWIRENKPKPIVCEICNENPPTEIANKSSDYLRDINDYWWTCSSCHKRIDEIGKHRDHNNAGRFI